MKEPKLAELRETCPHCGAGCGSQDLSYDCGTVHESSGVEGRSEGCLRDEASRLRNQLATVTAERDGWMQNFDDVAQKLAELQQRLSDAPVAWTFCYDPDRSVESMPLHSSWERSMKFRKAMFDDSTLKIYRVRIVRDDQPEETVT